MKNKNKMAVIGLLVLVLLGVAVFAFLGGSKDDGEDQDVSIWGDESLGIDPAVDEALQGYRNILIYGIDEGNRSDIVIVAGIDKDTQEVKLESVYCDTYMQLNDEQVYAVGDNDAEYDFYRCNEAYSQGGITVATKEFNRHLDLNCREYVGFNFTAITKLIDAVGGIEVDVPAEVVPHTNGKILNAGVQTLNGEQAVAYLRVASDSTTAIRAERNQEIMVKVINKTQTLGESELSDILETFEDDLDTNMTGETLYDMLKLVSKVDVDGLDGWPYDYDVMNQDGDDSIYYYVPDTLESNVTALHEKMFGQTEYAVSDVVKKLSEEIEGKKTEKVIR
ncbi:MAG: LCP family protein [Firmicutes bacterium]|nr:LCP family protein [Bacillota bacterium]